MSERIFEPGERTNARAMRHAEGLYEHLDRRGGPGYHHLVAPALQPVISPAGQRSDGEIANLGGDAQSWTETIISTSTGASRGRTATPTAERAWNPASPKAAASSSEAPLMTPG